MMDCGFRAPRGRGREEQVEREVAEALPMLAKALDIPLPGAPPPRRAFDTPSTAGAEDFEDSCDFS